MYKNILVALDGSQPSDHALRSAVDLASTQGADLTLVHALLRYASLEELYDLAERHNFPDSEKKKLDKVEVIPPTPYGLGEMNPVTMVPEKTLVDIAEAYLGSAERKAQEAGIKDIKKVICSGEPAHGIITAAKENMADLIVIGSRGYGDVKSLFLGSVSHKVIQESDIPCLVTK